MSDSNDQNDAEPALRLPAVINTLRRELTAAMQPDDKTGVRFNLNAVEVELQTVIENNDEVEGGFDFKIVKFGGKAGIKDASIHTIRLSLDVEVLKEDGSAGRVKMNR